MFDNVVVAIDEYERGRDALELAEELGSDGGEMTLVYVEVLQEQPSPEADTRPDDERQQSGLGRLRKLRDETHSVAEVSRIQAPSVRRGLHEFAAGRAADLIVIGAGSRSPVTRMVLGDEARAVLDDAPCAVAVAPHGYAARPHDLSKIGVAYDGSPESEQALALARRIANEHDSTLSAFKAVHAPAYARDIWDVEGEVDERIEEASQRIAALGGVEPHAALADDTVKGLRDYEASVDLLVLGSHSYSPPEHLVPRSKSQRLADEPARPLLVLASKERRRPASFARARPSRSPRPGDEESPGLG